MSCLRKVGWTIASNTSFNDKFEGEGMTVELDETFLKSKKDGRGRPFPSSKVIIFGIYCRETKDGIFLPVPRYNKGISSKSSNISWIQRLRPSAVIKDDGIM
jgi:hypothetical protein